MRTLFYTHNYRSKGARALRNGLGIRTFLRERQEDSRVTIRPSDVVINWGSASCWPQGCEVWNDPGKVNITGNKLLFFKKAWGGAGFKVPKWTTDPAVAADWNVCVSRTDLRGSQVAGLTSSTSEKSGETTVKKKGYLGSASQESLILPTHLRQKFSGS